MRFFSPNERKIRGGVTRNKFFRRNNKIVSDEWSPLCEFLDFRSPPVEEGAYSLVLVFWRGSFDIHLLQMSIKKF